jgi:hypothetical protein
MAKKCKNDNDDANEILLVNASDIKIVNGEIKIKRKYGKFKRPAYKLTNNGKETN